MKKETKEIKSIESLEEKYLSALESMSGGTSAAKEGVQTAQTSKSDKKDIVTQDLVVEVSLDEMTVYLSASECEPFSIEDINKKLSQKGVVFGVDQEAVAQAAEKLRDSGGWPGKLVVARGQEGAGPILDYPFLTKTEIEKTGQTRWLIHGILINFAALKKVFSTDDVTTLTNISFRVKAVQPGEVLARLKANKQNIPGKNVYGLPIEDDIENLKAGEHVQYNNKDGTYTSMIYGYLYIEDNRMSVLSPVTIFPDKMTAYFINLPQVSPINYPTVKNFGTIRQLKGVKKPFINMSVLEEICTKFSEEEEMPTVIKIAQGSPPKPGTDARFNFLIETEVKAGTLRENDTIDLRERSSTVNSVAKGTLLAELIPATKGTLGYTLLGDKIKTTNGKDLTIKTNDGVRVEKKVGKLLYYAQKEGNVSYKDGFLALSSVYTINGDVNYDTGNVKVKTDLVVLGSVLPGFKVECAGNAIIKNSVEQGASIVVHGNLTVEKGIIGETTQVMVFGDLKTDFVQDANIIARGDVTVKSYLFNAILRAGGQVKILREAGRKGGRAVGGIICATKCIELTTIGSPTTKNTVVALQPDPEMLAQLKKLTQQEKDISYNITKILRTLNLTTADPVKIRAILAKVPADKKEMYIKLLGNLKSLITNQQLYEERKLEIQTRIEETLQKAFIRVAGEFYQGNEVQIGSKKYVPKSDMGPSIFQLKDDRITF